MDDLKAQMFEKVFNQSKYPIAILKADKPAFTIVAFNEYFKATTHTPTHDLNGKSAFEVYQPYDKNTEQQFTLLINGLNQSINSNQQVHLAPLFFERHQADGAPSEPTWWQIQISPIVDDQGMVEYLMCITLNITQAETDRLKIENKTRNEQRLNAELNNVNEELAAINEELFSSVEKLSQSQETLHLFNNELEARIAERTAALTESENRYRSMLNALPQIAWTNTVKGKFDFYNQRWYDYTGLTLERSKATGWLEVIHPDDLQQSIEKFNSIIKNNEPGEFEVREKGDDGVHRWHLLRMEPIRNKLGDVDFWIGTATNIDQLKQVQQQKDDFISIASHELKTPITALSASLQILKQLKLTPESKMLGAMIDQANKSMDKVNVLIEGLLNSSRLNQGQITLNKNTFILSEIIFECCYTIEQAKDVKIGIKGDLSSSIYADPVRIEQVVINLVNNAIKHAPASDEIEITIKNDNKSVIVSVKDSGPGISQEKVSHIFDRYFRGDNNDNNTPGLGLGLYISAELVKLHQGQIGVTSEVGSGSTFWFSIPINNENE